MSIFNVEGLSDNLIRGIVAVVKLFNASIDDEFLVCRNLDTDGAIVLEILWNKHLEERSKVYLLCGAGVTYMDGNVDLEVWYYNDSKVKEKLIRFSIEKSRKFLALMNEETRAAA